MSSIDMYENRLNEVLPEWKDLGKWLYLDEAAEMLGVSRRTIFTYLNENKVSGIKSRGKRLISTGSVIGFLLKQKMIEINSLKEVEVKKEVLYHLRTQQKTRRVKSV